MKKDTRNLIEALAINSHFIKDGQKFRCVQCSNHPEGAQVFECFGVRIWKDEKTASHKIPNVF